MKQSKNLIFAIPRLVLWVVVLSLIAMLRFVSDILAIVRIIVDALDRMPRYASEHLLKELE